MPLQDVGGITPGSMPPMSHTLAEEGAAILSFKLVKGGKFQVSTFCITLLTVHRSLCMMEYSCDLTIGVFLLASPIRWYHQYIGMW